MVGIPGIITILCLTTWAAPCNVPPSSVREWFDREVEALRTVSDLDGMNIYYTEEILPVLTEEELRSLRENVADKPDHPGRETVMQYDRYVTTGRGHIVSMQVFSAGDSRWRWCVSHPGEYWDSAMTGKGSWSLSSKVGTFHPPGDPASAAAAQHASMLIPHVLRPLHGGLGVFRTANLGIRRFDVQADGSWRVIASISDKPDSSYYHTFKGRWDAQAGRGFVEESEIRHGGTQGPVVEHETYESWTHSADLGRCIASRGRRFDERDRHSRTYQPVSVSKNPVGIDEILRSPTIDGTDPVRACSGWMRFLTISRRITHAANPTAISPAERSSPAPGSHVPRSTWRGGSRSASSPRPPVSGVRGRDLR